jgi:hypothetical protein
MAVNEVDDYHPTSKRRFNGLDEVAVRVEPKVVQQAHDFEAHDLAEDWPGVGVW